MQPPQASKTLYVPYTPPASAPNTPPPPPPQTHPGDAHPPMVVLEPMQPMLPGGAPVRALPPAPCRPHRPPTAWAAPGGARSPSGTVTPGPEPRTVP